MPGLCALSVVDVALTYTCKSDEDSLASLRSSIINYRKENGRTYHRMSDGSEYTPGFAYCNSLIDIAHQLWLLTYDDELCNCPKKEGAKRVLDIGTGNGIWAMDYAEAHPEASVIGVDLSAIQPGYVPANCHFELDDVEKEWTWNRPFDFIFIRSLISSFKDWRGVIQKAFVNLEENGHLEIQDNLFSALCDDDTMTKDSKLLRWSQLSVEGTDKIGQRMTVASEFESMLKEVGFVDVEVRMEKWPVGPWSDEPKLKEMGKWVRSAILNSIDGLCIALFTRVLGWTPEETIVFCAEVRNEARKAEVHSYFPVYAVWGRKSEQPESP
ncbi:methyltransferase domain-containing protein [Colletotrichum sojae]|uniref:Methyltransferase domain-containing protein n=1 Tax=Colletotrichum sojae TaxID=2175907 RepID=A0A8H6JP40_9PEZI|nr:methyltransferase domain-containing protein [Colletotrichum sojae]